MNSNYARQIGGNNHKGRELNDYYATPPRAINDLLSKIELNNHIWEPVCGGGHLSQRLSELGYQVYSTDIVDRGYSNFEKYHASSLCHAWFVWEKGYHGKPTIDWID